MRRWLPIALLLAIAGLVVLGARWSSNRAQPVAATRPQPTVHKLADSSVEAPNPLETQSDIHPTRESQEEPTSPTPALEPNATLLLVHVRGKSTGKPVADAEVVAWVDGRSEPDYQSETFNPQPVTGRSDAAGELTLAVSPAKTLVVAVQPKDDSAGAVSIPIAALQPGQKLDVEALLPDGNDARVFGRVVAADSGGAISGARVRLIGGRQWYSSDGRRGGTVELALASSGTDGSFEFDYPGWREPHLRVEAEGYGVKLAAPLEECADSAHPLVIELARSASLRAHLTGGDGLPLDALRVELMLDGTTLLPEDQQNRGDLRAGFPDEHWEAKSDRDGWVSFVDLPAQVYLGAIVHMGARVVQPEGGALELAPGEAREVEWRMGAGCALSGIVVDSEGKPVTATQIWLANPYLGSGRYFTFDSKALVQQVATTNLEGRFEMPGVPRGAWFIGPAPDGQQEANETRIAPAAERIVIGDERSKAVTLRVQRGLYIRGTVLDPDGRPSSSSTVHTVDDSQLPRMMYAETKADGSYTIGPLRAQPIWLVAHGFRCVNSLPVRVDPGASGIELRLRRGGTINGRVVDAVTGKGCLASVDFALEGSSGDSPNELIPYGSEENGSFESPPLLGGSYSIGSMTEDGRFGFVKGIGIATGAVQDDVVVQVHPGARLRLTYTGSSETVWGRIVCDGVVLNSTGPIRKGKLQTIRVPAGTCAFELNDGQALVARETISMRAGESRDLALGDKK